MEKQEESYQRSEKMEAPEKNTETGIQHSPSLQSVISGFEPGKSVTSFELVTSMARIHPKYAHGRLEKLSMSPESSLSFVSKPVSEWIADVEALFDPEKADTLHGRLFLLGLCELDKELKKLFTDHGTFDALHDELKEDFSSLLKKEPSLSEDPSVLHLDSDERVDRLGREGFVEALATWLNRFWWRSNPPDKESNENSFMMHLHGPWGSGKSTLLNLLKENLIQSGEEKELEWMVINFNAWQHCHVEPVWWPLLNRLYKKSREELKGSGKREQRMKASKIWWYDFYWKLISGNKSTGYWFGLFVLLLILVSIPDINDEVQSYGQFAAFAGSAVTGFSYFFRSLIWGSADSARDYLKLTQDPLEKIKTYFKKIVSLTDRPVMIFIDDLDRCPASYVVDLLESLQTLFNNSRVFYVLAADRRWLYGSFEERYGEFSRHIEEPGKQIGYLFLDKLFQLSISVPQISPEMREDYLNYLYLGDTKTVEDIETLRKQVKEEFKEITSESELIDKLGQVKGGRGMEQIRREEAVRASARYEIETSTEYFLKQFAYLLESNPRSIKRLVNNYGIYRAIVMLSDLELIDTEEKRKKFALWNIVAMRWPMLAEYMEDNPLQIPSVLKNDGEKITMGEIRDLIGKSGVQDVFQGKGIGTSLDADYVTRILSLQAAPA